MGGGIRGCLGCVDDSSESFCLKGVRSQSRVVGRLLTHSEGAVVRGKQGFVDAELPPPAATKAGLNKCIYPRDILRRSATSPSFALVK